MTTGDSPIVDLLVVGGGINGAGIARDAAGRGLSVVLCEKDDLAQGTSSRSGKYIHGGLRYLEYYEFRLVREALTEREVLLKAAPHIIWPMRIVLPHSAEQRPAWLVRLGLFLYDHLGKRNRLPGCRSVDLVRDPAGQAIQPRFTRGFEYSDCWVDDARLVILNAIDAAARGAQILTHTPVVSARRHDGHWDIEVGSASGGRRRLRARVLVNAAGPWVEDVLNRVSGVNSRRRIRLVKGSHIVVPKFWAGPHAYLLQHTDRRVIFVNPYEEDLCLIGTTDIPYEGTPDDAAIDEHEIDYLLAAVNRYTRRQLVRGDIRHFYSGVRPLYDDKAANPSAVTRDYVFDIDASPGAAPLLSVFGGKLTTYRKLAEHSLDKLAPYLAKLPPTWTAKAALPGGDLPGGDFELYVTELARSRPWLPPALVRHYARLYGTRADHLLDGAKSMEALGENLGGLVYERELDYLVEHEWAKGAEDVLERRTKHGLHLDEIEKARVADWMKRRQ